MPQYFDSRSLGEDDPAVAIPQDDQETIWNYSLLVNPVPVESTFPLWAPCWVPLVCCWHFSPSVGWPRCLGVSGWSQAWENHSVSGGVESYLELSRLFICLSLALHKPHWELLTEINYSSCWLLYNLLRWGIIKCIMPCKFVCMKSFIIACALLASCRGPGTQKFLLSHCHGQCWAGSTGSKHSRDGPCALLTMCHPKLPRAWESHCPWPRDSATMEKGITGHSRISVFLTKCDLFAFFFSISCSNKSGKQITMVTQKNVGVDLLVCVCGELKKCVERFIYLFTNLSYCWLFDPKWGQKFLEKEEL